MTFEIGLVLGILAIAVVLFASEKLRGDVVALLVLLSLTLSGLINPKEALAGFSNPAVVTVWAVFILSGGLTRTGIAAKVGQHVLALAGQSELGLVVSIMLTAGGLSAFMNNVGVAALMLPVVMDICRSTRIPPSKLLIPLAFSSLLGGLVTQIGTPPNILISEAAVDFGLEPFSLFDFTPVGITVMLAGTAYMALFGRHLLPAGDQQRSTSADSGDSSDPGNGNDSAELGSVYGLLESLHALQLPDGAHLAGMTLAESRLGSALGLSVVAIGRDGGFRLAPHPQTVLEAGDLLMVDGDLDRLEELKGKQSLDLDDEFQTVARLVVHELDFHELSIAPHSPFVGSSLRQLDFRNRYGLNVLAVWRKENIVHDDLADLSLAANDTLLVQAPRESLAKATDDPGFVLPSDQGARSFSWEDRLLMAHVPERSYLEGKTLAEARLGDAFGLLVVGIARQGKDDLAARHDERLCSGDILLIVGQPEDLAVVQGYQQLVIEPQSKVELRDLESSRVGLGEAVLSPRSNLAGATLKGLRFASKYGLNVLAVMRDGQTLRRDIRTLPLRHSDAFLLHGPREQIKLLGREADFIVLTQAAQEPVRSERAPVAAAIMALVIGSVILGWLPIYIAAILGSTLMVLSRSLTMDEAYAFIEWRAVFLIAGMLPLGVALEKTGAAGFVTGGVVDAVGGFGAYGIVAALYLVTAVAAQVMPTAAVAILMAPIAFNTATDLGLSPAAMMMTVALSASASFMSPVAHPANVLIMGPGGYRFSDYIKVGLPLTLICLAVVLLVLPLVWPLYS